MYIWYMYKKDLALNNLQGWDAIKPNQPTYIFNDILLSLVGVIV